MSVSAWIKGVFRKQKISEPREAYDVWALAYDNQPGNLMLDLDEQITGEFLATKDLAGKTVADIGCGTGRHWKKIVEKNPARLAGFDVSTGMLKKLKEKFPASETFALKSNRLEGLDSASCDIIISTLTIAHIENIGDAFSEWNRVLKPGGEIFITENHPEALARGGQRTFKHEGKLISVRNHIHSLEKIRGLAGQLGWTEIRFTEKIIDDSVKSYYEQQNALPVFEKFRGVPVFYGIHLKKENGPA
ncbi:MAG TPA: class I SAM-dependent methyltransferase [Chitinophagaceae bacterium]|jgi:ubiquinone/menaquinone biosynthesis C-methylase UbiE|nr:class I SAM-dependent methyltransferase [Chitinophagaceae bacterium]